MKKKEKTPDLAPNHETHHLPNPTPCVTSNIGIKPLTNEGIVSTYRSHQHIHSSHGNRKPDGS